MRKKCAGLLVIIFVMLLAGCETTKGVGEGMSSTGSGIAKDTKNLWANIMKADQWIRENMW
ncbi:MAG: hypothetical protein PHT31_05560 [Candidatus Omnitrophica bacterium]|nr:hypothetical protein [Candidatus Omnitrophota bacterium]MDD5653604.1 hypothetical protein [Candidatus Omnitrophota bacterium]